jgi:hypothetical protein
MIASDKRILRVGAVAIVLLVAILITYGMLSMDGPPPQDGDLMLVRLEAPEEQNGVALVCQAGEKVQLPEEGEWIDDFLAGKDWDQAKVDALLAENAEALALWRQGLERPAFQVPVYPDTSTSCDYIYPVLHLRDLADLGAASLHRQGKDAEAFDEAMRLVRFGRKVMAGKGALIDYQVGVSLEESGLARLRKMIPEARLDGGRLASYEKALAAGAPTGAEAADAFRGEYQARAADADSLVKSAKSRDERGTSFFFKVNRTKTAIAEQIRPYVEGAARPYAEMAWPERPHRIDDNGELVRVLVSGNGIGQWMLGLMIMDFRGIFESKCQENVSVSATRILLAMRRYKIDHAALPATLDDLVPTYLDAVPRDDFDGKPLRYSASPKAIYSVGVNLVDDGGEAKARDDLGPGEKAQDVVFPVRF